MKHIVRFTWIALILLFAGASTLQTSKRSQTTSSKPSLEQTASTQRQVLKVVILGTGGPTPRIERFGPSILVEAGGRHFLFDCGRGAAQRLFQLGILDEVNALFLTHLHSDHVVGIPDFWLSGWFRGRSTPLQVWGPTGTQEMVAHLQKAYAFDIQTRTGSPEFSSVSPLAHTGACRNQAFTDWD